MEKVDYDFNKDQQLSVEYHRSYRKLHYGRLGLKLFTHLLLFLVIAVLILLFLEQLTYFYSGMTASLLTQNIKELYMSTTPLFFQNIWIVDAQGVLPSQVMLFWVALFSIIAWLIVLVIKEIPLPIRLGVKVLGFLNLAGCIYFWFWGKHFPYVMRDFSTLYVSAEIGMWIAIPLMLIFALLPIPVLLWKKTVLVLFTLLYTFVFGFIRYALFIFILAKFSYLWMAFLYFVLGVFFDFAFMIAFYSYFISLVAPSIFRKQKVWKWLFSS